MKGLTFQRQEEGRQAHELLEHQVGMGSRSQAHAGGTA